MSVVKLFSPYLCHLWFEPYRAQPNSLPGVAIQSYCMKRRDTLPSTTRETGCSKHRQADIPTSSQHKNKQPLMALLSSINCFTVLQSWTLTLLNGDNIVCIEFHWLYDRASWLTSPLQCRTTPSNIWSATNRHLTPAINQTSPECGD